MLSKDKLTYLIENLKVKVNDTIFIHHPITDDLVKVNIKLVKKNTVIVAIPEDSDYYGQPDFEVKKYEIISV